jgi:1-acyl-sn-glycerol-3-phosphate acyltransferase
MVEFAENRGPGDGARNAFALGVPTGPLLFYRLVRLVGTVAFQLCYGLRAIGRNNVPRRGGAVIASNHQSFMDPWLLGVAARRPLAFLARQDLFASPLFGRVISNLSAIPVPRESLSPEALRRAVRALRGGWPLVVFPEGTRTHDGRIAPLRRGIGLLADRAGVPVVPARIAGAFAAWPRHRTLPRIRGRVTIAFGPVLVYDRRTDTYDSFTERLAHALAALPGNGDEAVARAPSRDRVRAGGATHTGER